MQKLLFYVFCLTLLFSSSLNAALYKGQKLYVMKCRSCHGLGQVFIVAKKQREWAKLMENNGAPIANIHLRSKEAEETHEYFRGPGWERNAKHIREFMIEYAADSGNIPACE